MFKNLENMKKPPSKVAHNRSPIFFPYCQPAQNPKYPKCLQIVRPNLSAQAKSLGFSKKSSRWVSVVRAYESTQIRLEKKP
jgi:hypothetical protein